MATTKPVKHHRHSSQATIRHLPPWLLQGYGTTGTHYRGGGADSQHGRLWKKFRENSVKGNSDKTTPKNENENNRYKYSVSASECTALELSDRRPTKPSLATSTLLPSNHDCLTSGCQRVIINVSGQRYETQLRTLDRFPGTLLGDPAKRRCFWDSRRNEFFLDRHRPTFQAILYYYQSGGRLRRPIEVPEDVFLEEIEFYQLGEDTIRLYRQKEGFLVEKKMLLPEVDWQRRLWLFCEEPDSSLAARVFAIISVICILVSVVNFCMETLPSFERPVCINVSSTAAGDSTTWRTTFFSSTLSSSSSAAPNPDNASAGSISPYAGNAADSAGNATGISPAPHAVTYHMQPNYRDPFFIVETICVAWFTVEFILRFISCPSKRHFCRSIMNIFDVLAIIPFFVILIIQQTEGNCESAKKSGSFVFIRVLRVFRIFKLSKHSQGLRILGLTIKTSLNELGMFFFFLLVAMVIFSSAAYYAEAGEEGTQLTSIPGAFWWAIVTMTTVGYGDVTPVGIWGKLVGTLCVIAGVLTIALPVPVVVANFNNFYRHDN